MKNFEEKIQELQQINKTVFNYYWLDNNTFVLYFNVRNEDLQPFFPNLIEDNENCSIFAEYHEDEHKIIYMLEFDEESIDISDNIESLYLDYFILQTANSLE